MSVGDSDVTVGTVTYGDRASVCIRVVEQALASGASRAVIVDNGSATSSARTLDAWAGRMPNVEIVRLEKNEGSASGFRALLGRAAALDTDWVWLLDDDNLPRSRSLESALQVAAQDPDVVVACFRTADAMQTALLGGAAVEDTLAVRGSFNGVDLLRRLRPPRASGTPRDVVEVPWAPYGGLLLPVSAVRSVELPLLEFVLYGDDRDYSERLRASGFRILLTGTAPVDDIVDRWGGEQVDAPPQGHVAAMIASGDRRRAYYLIRNNAFDDLRRAKRDRAVGRMTINACVFVVFTAFVALRAGHARFLPLLGRAVLQGLSGRWYPRSVGLTTTRASA